MKGYATIDEYIEAQVEDVRVVLQKIRGITRKVAPDASETISYGMPTLKLNGKNLVHFAAFKNHIGFFPTPSAIDALDKETKPYRTGKGTMQFPHNKPVPWDLIARITKFRLDEIKDKTK